MTARRPLSVPWWASIIVAAAIFFAVAAPRLPSLLPSTEAATPGQRLSLNAADVAAPAGWSIDIASASMGYPSVSSAGVVVAVYDGTWFGASKDLVARLEAQVRSGGGELTGGPGVPDEADGSSREEYTLRVSWPEGIGRVVIVRDNVSVVVLRVFGTPTALIDARDEIDAMIASVRFDSIEPVFEQPSILDAANPSDVSTAPTRAAP